MAKVSPDEDRVKPQETDEVVVRSPLQFKALASPIRLAVLERLIHGSATARVLSEELGVPQTRLYHHLKILREGGFIEVVGVRKVRGTTEHAYAATAREVKLDPEMMSSPATATGAAAALRSAFRLVETEILGAYTAGRGDEVMIEQAQIRLSRDDRRRLERRLQEWIGDVTAAFDPEGEEALRITVAVHPSAPERGA
ncbi:MAG: winged helix-turn-helix domain-containing protein [Gemmatimonadetes bacterium]|nr:winged helix-turn-helix domain-containing protein [Gemmatimonadota bacterium]